jgi:hypothetical protein
MTLAYYYKREKVCIKKALLVTILTCWLIRTKFSKYIYIYVLLHFFEQVVPITKLSGVHEIQS